MARISEILICDTVESLPSIQNLLVISREKPLCVVFSPPIQGLRESIGKTWKTNLPGFAVGIHLERPEINIRKLISDEEIEKNCSFFEQCAKDYRKLATSLIHSLARHIDENIDPENAMNTFGKHKRVQPRGEVGLWKYRFHGAGCEFVNTKSGQTIEVYLLTQLEFGKLDPYFFIQFIKSTIAYQPLPIEIYEDGPEGGRILDKMVELGRFERIHSFIAGHDFIVVKDRSDEDINDLIFLSVP